MPLEQLYRDFAASQADFKAVCTSDVSENPHDMVDDLIRDRDMFVKDVFRFKKGDRVRAPVDLKRLTAKFNNPYATKTDLSPEYVAQELTNLS